MTWIGELIDFLPGLLATTSGPVAVVFAAAASGLPQRQNDAGQDKKLEKAGLPDGSDDRNPEKAEKRKFLAATTAFSYLIALFIGLVIIAIAYSVWM